VTLEKHVHDNLITTDFSQVFASAADVARTGRGDCTEYAVLLAALCRARGIPARVAFGLVYVAPQQGFLYHMWTEVWIKDRWIPIDATLGRGGIGADHLKLSDSNLKGASAYTSLLPIANVVGRLKIDVVRAE
jgi:transglutaminase/protease-like cytokinesis protein 3